MTPQEARSEMERAINRATWADSRCFLGDREHSDEELVRIYMDRSRAYEQLAKALKRVQEQFELTGQPRGMPQAVS